MFDSIWPIALVVLSNTFYQICAKEVPEKMDPFASLTVTYLVGAAVSFALFGLLNRGGSIVAEYQKLNWAPFVLGLVLVGLETGFIYAYRAGWTVSTAAIRSPAAMDTTFFHLLTERSPFSLVPFVTSVPSALRPTE